MQSFPQSLTIDQEKSTVKPVNIASSQDSKSRNNRNKWQSWGAGLEGKLGSQPCSRKPMRFTQDNFCLLNLAEKDKARVRRGGARCRNCVDRSGSPSCSMALHSCSYHLWDTNPAVLCFCACHAQRFLTDDRGCCTNWDTLESKMDAINNCVWTIDLNSNGPERNEEALFQTCVFNEDWITLSQFFVLKAKSETLTI